MSARKLIECVPNFSEGVNLDIIKSITDEIQMTEGVRLLDVDPGKATNRTVVTFVGHPDDVIEAAFRAIKKASQNINMANHTGEHPRMGATDVCPLIPISGISMEETVEYAEKLAERVGNELFIPVYLYESAAKSPERQNLATIRSGEYEGLARKLKDPNWKPDYGPDEFNAHAGATVIGARDFLVAYNVNLNTTSVRRANAIAFDVREKGRIKRQGNPLNGPIVRDSNGEAVRIPGTLKSVKAIGWYIREYGIAQISMNLTDLKTTSLHEAFEAVRASANNRGMRVTGSELVGLIPKKVLLDAGKYFLQKQERSIGISENEIIQLAVKSLGLDELGPFDPYKKVIEYLLEDDDTSPLVKMTLTEFADETASESPAPGGGSISAYVGALGVSLGTMVANLSAHKRGWDDRWDYFSKIAEQGQRLKMKLLDLVDEDTSAFNKIIEAVRMPKSTPEEKTERKNAMNGATRYAIEVPLLVMQTSLDSFDIMESMAENGNPASVSDAGVGALCAYTAVYGAYLNVMINCKDYHDASYVEEKLKDAKGIMDEAGNRRDKVLSVVKTVINT
ncbi:MAG: glutamate formimidoyltransferase [Saprospiraceae bacterium]|nr:glutamate formimidoyltransferase [Saprospiraceae bacterium]